MSTIKELVQEIRDLQREIEVKRERLAELRQDESKDSREQYRKLKEFRKGSGEWLFLELQENHIVKVSGTRSGPMRRITAIGKGNCVGQVLTPLRHGGFRMSLTEQRSFGIDKITHVYDEALDKFIHMREIMKEGMPDPVDIDSDIYKS